MTFKELDKAPTGRAGSEPSSTMLRYVAMGLNRPFGEGDPLGKRPVLASTPSSRASRLGVRLPTNLPSYDQGHKQREITAKAAEGAGAHAGAAIEDPFGHIEVTMHGFVGSHAEAHAIAKEAGRVIESTITRQVAKAAGAGKAKPVAARGQRTTSGGGSRPNVSPTDGPSGNHRPDDVARSRQHGHRHLSADNVSPSESNVPPSTRSSSRIPVGTALPTIDRNSILSRREKYDIEVEQKNEPPPEPPETKPPLDETGANRGTLGSVLGELALRGERFLMAWGIEREADREFRSSRVQEAIRRLQDHGDGVFIAVEAERTPMGESESLLFRALAIWPGQTLADADARARKTPSIRVDASGGGGEMVEIPYMWIPPPSANARNGKRPTDEH